uniref:Uncharacterized protein n=1 Tax=Anguilla anguilla TaxID=7936 RepID=A0A0E9QX09_ANGAN
MFRCPHTFGNVVFFEYPTQCGHYQCD